MELVYRHERPLFIISMVIGVLAAIAIPGCHDYTMRAQVMQAMVVADQVQDAA